MQPIRLAKSEIPDGRSETSLQPIRLAKSEIPDGRSETSPKSNSEADGNEVKSAAAMSIKEF